MRVASMMGHFCVCKGEAISLDGQGETIKLR